MQQSLFTDSASLQLYDVVFVSLLQELPLEASYCVCLFVCLSFRNK